MLYSQLVAEYSKNVAMVSLWRGFKMKQRRGSVAV
jgi:hypothetical protein